VCIRAIRGLRFRELRNSYEVLAGFKGFGGPADRRRDLASETSSVHRRFPPPNQLRKFTVMDDPVQAPLSRPAAPTLPEPDTAAVPLRRPPVGRRRRRADLPHPGPQQKKIVTPSDTRRWGSPKRSHNALYFALVRTESPL
jgi:hypothetical protein